MGSPPKLSSTLFSSSGHLYSRSRIRWLSTVSLAFLLALSFAAFMAFQINAFRATEWSFSLQKATFPGLERQILEICSVRNGSYSSNSRFKSAKLDEFCMIEGLLIKLRKELRELTLPLIQNLAEMDKILVNPVALGGDRNDPEGNVRNFITFMPIKNSSFNKPQDEEQTWFMSSFDRTMEDENGLLSIPLKASRDRILCVKGNDTRDGTKNGYALAWRDRLPPGWTLLPGVTYIARESHYFNIYHCLRGLGVFLHWYKRNETEKPARIVLYGQGEIQFKMSPWIGELLQAGIGYKVPVINLQDYGGGDRTVCFERAVVNRHGFARFSAKGLVEFFDTVREKARRYCNVIKIEGLPRKLDNQLSAFNFTLLTRSGNRSFKNESAVVSILQNECGKVLGCRFRVFKADGLTFCDQVQVLSATQVLVSVHGAQVTNMVFMERGSHVMEMFPDGWLQYAGQGQYVYHWLANLSGMKHEGDWRDTRGSDCPKPEKGEHYCFLFFKNQKVGYTVTNLAKWTSDVLRKVGIAAGTANTTSV